jgi:UDP-N-acetylglucosamine 2-epimerase (non-hydrolysing)
VAKLRVLVVFGTRPEAIKLCPVIRALKARPDRFEVCVCATAQHRQMLDQVLNLFGITPDYDLDLMRDGQSLAELSSRLIERLDPVLEEVAPGLTIVQGDTTTTFCAALASFYRNLPVGHVEAGLRTGDLSQPFPEELNRVLVSRIATLHFAPTNRAASHLLSEGVPQTAITVTGNTGIDAVLYTRNHLPGRAVGCWNGIDQHSKWVVVTAHRRESFGAGFGRICAALRRIAEIDGVRVVYPVHPNPNVSRVVRQNLGGHPRIHLIEPLDYVSFVDLMNRGYVLLTDSGGIQEEAPSLGKPVLVLREKTERPEAVEAGTARLVGTDVDTIVSETERLLRDDEEYDRRRRIHNPYGDGRASERIVDAILAWSAQ